VRDKLKIFTDDKKELKRLAQLKNIASDTIGMRIENRKDLFEKDKTATDNKEMNKTENKEIQQQTLQ
jgi:hypothetical protein